MPFFLKKIKGQRSCKELVKSKNAQKISKLSSDSTMMMASARGFMDLWSSYSSESSDTSISDLIDYNLNLKKKSKEVNREYLKLQRLNAKLENRKRLVSVMGDEVEELRGIIHSAEAQLKTAGQKGSDKQPQKAGLANQVSMEEETEIKRQELLLYKKYFSIKNDKDAINLLAGIRHRRMILLYLEFMLYRKHLRFAHNLSETETSLKHDAEKEDGSTQRVVTSLLREIAKQNCPFEREGAALKPKGSVIKKSHAGKQINPFLTDSIGRETTSMISGQTRRMNNSTARATNISSFRPVPIPGNRLAPGIGGARSPNSSRPGTPEAGPLVPTTNNSESPLLSWRTDGFAGQSASEARRLSPSARAIAPQNVVGSSGQTADGERSTALTTNKMENLGPKTNDAEMAGQREDGESSPRPTTTIAEPVALPDPFGSSTSRYRVLFPTGQTGRDEEAEVIWDGDAPISLSEDSLV